jgi:hypothetical protein
LQAKVNDDDSAAEPGPVAAAFLDFVMGAITYLDRVNISISGHWLPEEYHFTNSQLGLIFGASLSGTRFFRYQPAGLRTASAHGGC